jgi:hypothetical protein
MALTAHGKVQLHTRTYSLDTVNDAMNDVDSGRLQGRGILVPSRTPSAVRGGRTCLGTRSGEVALIVKRPPAKGAFLVE